MRGLLAHPNDHLTSRRAPRANRPPGCVRFSRIQSTIYGAWRPARASNLPFTAPCSTGRSIRCPIRAESTSGSALDVDSGTLCVACALNDPLARRSWKEWSIVSAAPERRVANPVTFAGQYTRYVYHRLTPPPIPLHLEYRGRSGFDVFGEVEAACRGGRYLVNQRQQSQLPTINWHWLRK